MKVRVVRDGKAYEEEFKDGGHPVGTFMMMELNHLLSI
ncbi:Uncharacterised protein [Chlamydia trachomatis]|nr:Uncharacterised protein [Chlamydia trachomatis]